MKALTIKQPYASAIMLGHKQYETRTWHPGKTNEFALHAGLGEGVTAQTWLETLMPVSDWPKLSELPHGAVLGIVTITDVYPVDEIKEDIDEFEFHIGDWSNGYAWEIEVVEIFDTPIPAKGQLGFWNWTSPKAKQQTKDYLQSLRDGKISGSAIFTD